MQITAEFDRLVKESTDDSVTTLGEGVKVLFSSFLRQDLNLIRNDMPERLNDFCKEPTDLFGNMRHTNNPVYGKPVYEAYFRLRKESAEGRSPVK